MTIAALWSKNELMIDVIVLKVSQRHELRKLVWMPTSPKNIDQSKKFLVYQSTSKPSNRRRKRKTPMLFYGRRIAFLLVTGYVHKSYF